MAERIYMAKDPNGDIVEETRATSMLGAWRKLFTSIHHVARLASLAKQAGYSVAEFKVEHREVKEPTDG